LYVLTFGLAFLETTANPFILSMGDEKTATRRLNLAQAFNPFGSLLGMFVASQFILSNLQSDQRDAAGNVLYTTLELSEKAAIKTHDLEVIRDPYVILGFVVIVMLLLIGGAKIPENETKPKDLNTAQSFRNLIKNKKYREGVIAQMFYVGAQIMCWTFIIQYAHALGISKAAAQNFNILAMVIFLTSRFVSTFLMQYVNSKKLLMLFGIGGAMTLSITIFSQGMLGLYALVATSGFMSLMFPTIYGIALEGLGEDASLGAAGLVMAIVGGALMPPLQGLIIDMGTVGTLQAVNASFVLPLICFCVVTIYGYRSLQIHQSV
jgi:FHS family L-fucose permease-like MFS transporter